jgi:predicted small secreted protein
MRNINKPLTALFFISTILLATGCATIEGAGKDIESAGEKIQEAADS